MRTGCNECDKKRRRTELPSIEEVETRPIPSGSEGLQAELEVLKAWRQRVLEAQGDESELYIALDNKVVDRMLELDDVSSKAEGDGGYGEDQFFGQVASSETASESED